MVPSAQTNRQAPAIASPPSHDELSHVQRVRRHTVGPCHPGPLLVPCQLSVRTSDGCKPPTPRDRLYDNACSMDDRTRRTYALIPGSDDTAVIDPGGKSTQFLRGRRMTKAECLEQDPSH